MRTTSETVPVASNHTRIEIAPEAIATIRGATYEGTHGQILMVPKTLGKVAFVFAVSVEVFRIIKRLRAPPEPCF
jgi:hypothetical protein